MTSHRRRYYLNPPREVMAAHAAIIIFLVIYYRWQSKADAAADKEEREVRVQARKLRRRARRRALKAKKERLLEQTSLQAQWEADGNDGEAPLLWQAPSVGVTGEDEEDGEVVFVVFGFACLNESSGIPIFGVVW